MQRKLYVAETNGDGHIEHVWIVLKEGKPARPFDPSLHSFVADERAEFTGAERAAIKSWLAAKQTFHFCPDQPTRLRHAAQ